MNLLQGQAELRSKNSQEARGYSKAELRSGEGKYPLFDASFLLIFGVLVLHLLLEDILGNNEQDVLAVAKHFVTPSWVPGDWYLGQDIGYRWLFSSIAGFLARVMPLDILCIVGRVATYFLFALVMSRLIREFHISVIFVVPVIFAFVTLHQSLVAGEWMLGSFDTKSFSYISVLGAIIALLRRNYAAMFLLSGVALCFHILVGSYAFFCLLVTVIARSDEFKEDFSAILKKSYLFFVAGAPAFFIGIKYFLTTAGSSESSRAGQIYVFDRVPHHTLPSAWGTSWLIPLVLAIVFFALIIALSHDRRKRILASYALASSILFVVGIVIFLLKRYSLLKYYWFRFPDTMIPFLAIFLFASLFGDFLQRGTRQSTTPGMEAPYVAVLRRGVVILGMLVTVAGIVKSAHICSNNVRDMIHAEPPYYLEEANKNLREVFSWIKNNTLSDDTFLVSPAIEEFYIAAERPEFVAFKHVPQSSDKSIIEWLDRITLVNGGKTPAGFGFSIRQEVDSTFYHLPEENIKAIAKQYSLKYYLGKKDRQLSFKITHASGEYVVYAL